MTSTRASAGEEGPAQYIWEALEHLDVHRVDHGVKCLEDSELVKHLENRGMPLTVCPLSNLEVCVAYFSRVLPRLPSLAASLADDGDGTSPHLVLDRGDLAG